MFSEKLDTDKLKEEFAKHLTGKVAVKLHFGEPGNKTSLTPDMVRPITDLLDDFYLYDSPVMYGGPRGNIKQHTEFALKKGWGDLGDVVVDERTTNVKGKFMDWEVCKTLSEADSVLVLTHFKGHICCGFGGAIKNLGMGALSKRSKTAIHQGGMPVLGDGCIGCGECVKACPLNTMKMVNDKPEFGMCFGCSNCVLVCEHGALSTKNESFDNLLADGAIAALSTFKKVYFVTIVKNITKLCDCLGNPGKTLSPDVGFVWGESMTEVDREARDAIVKRHGDVFLEANKRTGLEHVEAAEKIINSLS